MASKGTPNQNQDAAIDAEALDLEAQVDAPYKISRTDEDEAKDKRKDRSSAQLATIREVFSFGSGRKKKVGLALGLTCSTLTGLIFPAMAFVFSNTFRALNAPTSDEYLTNIQNMAFVFIGLGVFAFLSMTAQTTLLEMAAREMEFSLKTRWFDALLRQDMTYFDMNDISKTATLLSSYGARYRAGIGRKLGDGVQAFSTFLGGFAYAFYATWRASLVLLAIVPFMSASMLFLVKMNQSQTRRANEGYAEAGSVVYSTVSAIRTVLSLNACESMIKKYTEATERAFQAAASYVTLLGLANGMSTGSMLFLRNVVVTLYGAYLLYEQVRTEGCDPSGTLSINPSGSCDPDGAAVMGAMIGIMMGAAGLPQMSVALESFTNARIACYPALQAIKRKVGSSKDENTGRSAEYVAKASKIGVSKRNSELLPKYCIDSSSDDGRQLSSVSGNISFDAVSFTYPTRTESPVFDKFSLSVKAGQTVALVGPSGCGKSTIVSLIERFYDPASGSIHLDGVDLRDLNVRWLREQIGLVSQEPVLFAKSIRENIAYGCKNATTEQIEEAAKLANAHKFIMSFPEKYETQVGDKGAQLSGGQKQRIAIARAVVRRPKLMVFDEATSALDSESEIAVQAALDQILESSSMTTIVIAHRLSTIRNADVIAVVESGKVVESGSHDKLLAMNGYYHDLIEAQALPSQRHSSFVSVGRASSRNSFLDNYGSGEAGTEPSLLTMRNVHFSYPTRPDAKVFRGLNLSLRQGETLALVGPSGEGKSTIVSLIERFYDPTSGSIALDGVDLKEMNVRCLRDTVGLVSQEPTLFDATIRENIMYGRLDASQEEVETAARLANAHDFICNFPEGYNTLVGECGTLVSGGQKQRIAIARAILKQPRLLMLDEATSALDSESESLVQAALDQLMASKSQTSIVVAHRLSTLRNADRIAVIAGGKVQEIGTHEELMLKPNGRYKRMSMYQSFNGEGNTKKSMKEAAKQIKEEEDEERRTADAVVESEWFDEEVGLTDEIDTQENSVRRARLLAKEDRLFFIVGSAGAVLAGLAFPAMGVLFSYMVELLYQPVFGCDEVGLPSCISIANQMQDSSFRITYGWLGVLASTLIGNVLLYYGFGTASERMNKRVRDTAFKSLVRQEVAFFDKRSVGDIASQLQDDAAMIHSFTGEPIRTTVVSLASLVVGLIISFVFMWPFALLTLFIIPFMAFGAKMKSRRQNGEDEGSESEDEHGAGGIAVETLLNMRTVAPLRIEAARSREYCEALKSQEPNPFKSDLIKGLMNGIGQLMQMWGLALMFWWGGWLLYRYPGVWSSRDFLISMFALFMSISGMAQGVQSTTDKEEAKRAAKRIFHLIDRQSAIDPLSEAGKKVE